MEETSTAQMDLVIKFIESVPESMLEEVGGTDSKVRLRLELTPISQFRNSHNGTDP